MISLEQVKLLESKVTRTIDHVIKVTDENKQLKGKLDSYQKRIDELEVLIQQFKHEQSRIEDGILSALDRLNQFEDALEAAISSELSLSDGGSPPAEKQTLRAKAENTLSAESGGEPSAALAEDTAAESKELDIF